MRTLSLTFSTLVCLLLSAGLATPSFATSPLAASIGDTNSVVPKELEDVGIKEHLGQKVSIESLHFKNEKGKTVALKDYLQGHRPVLLSMVYFGCPNLCTFVLNGMVKSLQGLDWTPGKQFDVVVVSIDPTEGPELASSKKDAYIESYGRPEAASGWHFLTGEESQIRQLASELGFGYKKEDDQYAHSAALFVLTPEGKISRYLYGIDFKATDLKLSLLEASDGKIGTVIERFLLFCYRYDPLTRKYSLYLSRVMQTGCAGTIFVFGAYMAVFWRRERRKRKST